MYDYINGIFTYKMSNSKGNFVTIQTGGGVGYLFEVMDRDFAKLPEENSYFGFRCWIKNGFDIVGFF